MDESSTALGPARQAADRYIELVNCGDYAEIERLFTEDAVFLIRPGGEAIRGSKAIGEHYVNHLTERRPKPRGNAYVEDGNQCVVRIELKNPKTGQFDVIAIDHFTVEPSGKIRRLDVFRLGLESSVELLEAKYLNMKTE